MKISRELIFKISKLRNLPFKVIFYSDSESAIKYDKELILNAVFTDPESEELLISLFSNIPLYTQGLIKADEAIKSKLTKIQLKNILTIGFNTEDIFEITYR